MNPTSLRENMAECLMGRGSYKQLPNKIIPVKTKQKWRSVKILKISSKPFHWVASSTQGKCARECKPSMSCLIAPLGVQSFTHIKFQFYTSSAFRSKLRFVTLVTEVTLTQFLDFFTSVKRPSLSKGIKKKFKKRTNQAWKSSSFHRKNETR